MGYLHPDPEASYHELPDELHDAVERTLSDCGVERFGNAVFEGTGEMSCDVLVKLQVGSGEELDLSDRTVRDHSDPTDEYDHEYDVLHHEAMLTEGRVEEVHENGYVTLLVRGRY